MSTQRMDPPTTLTVRAAAKINLHLGVGGVREDGFHPLATVYQAIGLYDDVSVSESPRWDLDVRTHDRIDAHEVPRGSDNIVIKAGRMLAEHHGLRRAAAIVIDKQIPVAAGLAGGSADAAATLVALDRLWELETSDEELLALAARLGSDVPFALIGGTATGHGRGEVVERVEDNGSWWWVAVESDIGLSTPAVYAELDRARTGPVLEPVVPPLLLAALRSGDPEPLAAALGNDLADPALRLRPDLGEVLEQGLRAGALAGQVSGSGPTCLFLCRDSDHAIDVRRALTEAGHERVQATTGPVAGAHPVSYS